MRVFEWLFPKEIAVTIDPRCFFYDMAFTTMELFWIFGFTVACVVIVLSPLIRLLFKKKK